MASRQLALLLGVWPPLALTIAASAGGGVSADDRPVLDIDLYRATESAGVNAWPLQNVDLGSVEGMTKYFHTEAIAEHVIGDSGRQQRKYGIDAFSRIRFKVKNPRSVVESSSVVTQVDFGPFVTFDSGVATNPHTQTLIKAHGGFVGAQRQMDPRWPSSTPSYWFSVTGWCPNVPFYEVPMTREEADKITLRRSSLCPRLRRKAACERRPDDCVYEEGECIARAPAPMCLNYSAAAGRSGHVLGGLCPGGDQNLVQPTGEPGCMYSYAKADQVSIDKVAGILDEDCGGRKCKSWIDFRQHCSNPEYRQKFNGATGSKEPFEYCVEYDINPLCEADCSKPACQALPESEREIGLPFWQGRCNEQANLARTEHVAASFGMAGAATDHDFATRGSEQKNSSAPCVYETPGVCAPSRGQGGNYCTRQWGGVCTPCFVPGTARTWAAATMPYCPYDVLSSPDYKDLFPPPDCASARPRDLCCLYTGACTLSGTDLAQAPLDEDGYALVVSRGNSSVLAAFLASVMEAREWSIDEERLVSFADTQWGRSPRKGASLESALARMLELNVAVQPTFPSSSTATSTSSSAASGSDATATSFSGREAETSSESTAPDEPDAEGASPSPGLITLLAVAVGLCAGCALAGVTLLRSRRLFCPEETDLEATGQAAAPSRAAADADAAAAQKPRLGLSGRSVAAHHRGQGFEGGPDKKGQLPEGPGCQHAADQEPPQQPRSPAATADGGAEAEVQSEDANSADQHVLKTLV